MIRGQKRDATRGRDWPIIDRPDQLTDRDHVGPFPGRSRPNNTDAQGNPDTAAPAGPEGTRHRKSKSACSSILRLMFLSHSYLGASHASCSPSGLRNLLFGTCELEVRLHDSMSRHTRHSNLPLIPPTLGKSTTTICSQMLKQTLIRSLHRVISLSGPCLYCTSVCSVMPRTFSTRFPCPFPHRKGENTERRGKQALKRSSGPGFVEPRVRRCPVAGRVVGGQPDFVALWDGRGETSQSSRGLGVGATK